MERKHRLSEVARDVKQVRPEQLHKRLREMDEQVVRQLSKRYRGVVPEERLKALQDLPTEFEDRQTFNETLRRLDETKDGDSMWGYSTGTIEPAHVAVDSPDVRGTTTHERLHQMSHPGSQELLGKRMDEGITQMLTERNSEPGAPENSRSNASERRSAQITEMMCGPQAIEKAYFQGNAGELNACLTRSLSRERLTELQQRLRVLSATEKRSKPTSQ